jgi:hypothetical protein
MWSIEALDCIVDDDASDPSGVSARLATGSTIGRPAPTRSATVAARRCRRAGRGRRRARAELGWCGCEPLAVGRGVRQCRAVIRSSIDDGIALAPPVADRTGEPDTVRATTASAG